jgi:hypothetical protein
VARLTDTLNVKLKFVTLGTHEQYEGIEATIINRNAGKIDAAIFRFADILGKKAVPNNPNFREGVYPYIWTYNGQSEWYAYTPTPRDFESISAVVDGYLEMFREPVQTQGMTQQMG